MFTSEDGNELKHDCELPPEEDILVKYINTGCLVYARRKIKHQFLLCEGNHQSKHYMKSSFVMKREKVRHLKLHYYMIHPFSSFALYSRVIMGITFWLLFLIIPLQIMLQNKVINIIKLILDTICIANIFLSFNMGYHNKKYNEIILKRTSVCKKYVCTWFFIDTISSLNATFICYLFPSICKDSYYVYLLSFLKILRVHTCYQHINEFRLYIGLSIFKCKIIKLILMNSFAFLWCSSFVYMGYTWKAPHKKHKTLFILKCLQKVVYTLFLFGSSDSSENTFQTIIEIFCLCMGTALRIIVVSYLLQIVTKYSSTGSKFYKLTQQVEEFMRYRNLPDALRLRIMNYFDFRFQQNYYNESEILRVISPKLRQEMLVHTHMHLLEKVLVFDDLPMSVLYTIIYSMKPEVYMPSDVIVIAGTVGDSMYFIASGTVAVYTPTGREVCHLSDGANFGEIALLMENEHRVATVVAIDCCELFVLSRKDFMQQLNKYPEVFSRLRKAGKEKVRKTLIASMRGDETMDVPSEIDSVESKKSIRTFYNP